MVQIRLARPADVDAIRAIVQDTLEPEANTDYISHIVESDVHQVWVAVVDNQVAGMLHQFITVSREGIRRAEVDLLGVLSVYQGQGIGQRLIGQAIFSAMQQDLTIIRALIAEDNRASQRAFANLQFMPEQDSVSLYVSQQVRHKTVLSSTNTHYIQVATMTYRGIWIEQAGSLGDLVHGEYLRTQKHLDIAGITIRHTDRVLNTAIVETAFEKDGDYRWWILESNFAKSG